MASLMLRCGSSLVRHVEVAKSAGRRAAERSYSSSLAAQKKVKGGRWGASGGKAGANRPPPSTSSPFGAAGRVPPPPPAGPPPSTSIPLPVYLTGGILVAAGGTAVWRMTRPDAEPVAGDSVGSAAEPSAEDVSDAETKPSAAAAGRMVVVDRVLSSNLGWSGRRLILCCGLWLVALAGGVLI